MEKLVPLGLKCASNFSTLDNRHFLTRKKKIPPLFLGNKILKFDASILMCHRDPPHKRKIEIPKLVPATFHPESFFLSYIHL